MGRHIIELNLPMSSDSITPFGPESDLTGSEAQRWHWEQMSLELGSDVFVFSERKKKWLEASIIDVQHDDDGEWLVVRYSGNRTKQVQRFSDFVRPRIETEQRVEKRKSKHKKHRPQEEPNEFEVKEIEVKHVHKSRKRKSKQKKQHLTRKDVQTNVPEDSVQAGSVLRDNVASMHQRQNMIEAEIAASNERLFGLESEIAALNERMCRDREQKINEEKRFANYTLDKSMTARLKKQQRRPTFNELPALGSADRDIALKFRSSLDRMS